MELNGILDEQILIAQLSNGITFSDTNNMDIYERRYIIEKLMIMKKEEVEAKEKALKNIKK